MSQDTEMIEVDPLLVLIESNLAVFSAILSLVPLHVDPHSVEHQGMIRQLQEGMNQLGHLAMALGSTSVQPKGDGPSPAASSIIIPR